MDEVRKNPSTLATILSELSPEVLNDEDIRQSAINLIGLFKLLSELDEQQSKMEVLENETKNSRGLK